MSSTNVDRRLELLFLGGFDLRLDGSALTGNTYAKLRALLAYLAVERYHDHSREFLAQLLWSGNDLATARGNLRRTLSDLRSLLELPASTSLFTTTRHSIRFVPNAYIDVADFSHQFTAFGHDGDCQDAEAERLAALYQGEFLAGLSLHDSPAFEDWLLLQREALHRRALALMERLANAYERRGVYDKALQFALRHTELSPWDESVHRRIMRLHALSDQPGAALAHYDACRRLLAADLGALPSEETGRLAERIRNDDLRAPSVASGAALPSLAPPSLYAERRQLTVLYCELTAPDLDDPDETMALLHAPQAHCVDIIRQFSGHVVQIHGGGLLAYFGYPQANEHAARHAVRAALAIIDGAATDDLEIHVGIHTGVVLTGGDAGLTDTSGHTSRQAILLRNIAGRNEVAISRETHDVTAGYFDCVSLGHSTAQGRTRPVEVFRVLRDSGARTRVDAAQRLTPLIGRDGEVARLAAAWDATARGNGRAVLIQGEPGIGKSRLLRTLKESLVGRPHAVRELHCFPEFRQSPFHPLIAMLGASFGFASGDTPETRFDKLAAYLEAHHPGDARQAISLLAPLLSLLPGNANPIPESSPKRQKEQILAVLLRLLQTLATQQPVLFVVEDLHWIDLSSLELLTLFVESPHKGAVLALFTARSEFVAPWVGTSMTLLPLAPLRDGEMTTLVASLDKDIATPTLRHIVERADGVPLFAEEMAKFATADKRASVPATLLDLLTARMDAVGEAKRAAQLAATLGRKFDPALLHRVSAADPVLLARHLDILQEAGLVLPAGGSLRQFKHALIQEVAYRSQSRTDRQAAHRRIADVLKSDFVAVIAAQPEILAQHLTGAGEIRSAISYWILAGQHAARRSGNLEAIGHFRAALQQMEALPHDRERDEIEFNILVNLFPIIFATEGYGSPDAGPVNARIAVLSQQIGDSPDLFPAKWTVLVNTIGASGPRGVPEAVEQLLPMAQNDAVRLHAAHHLGANSCFWAGDFEASATHYERSAALYQPEHTPQLIAQYGTDLSVFNASHGMFARHMLGFPDQAQTICAQSLARARATGHAHTLAQALGFAATLQRWQNKPEAALALATEAIALAREQDFPLWLVSAGMNSGWARAVLGDAEGGLAEIKASIDGMRQAIGGISVVFISALVHACRHLERYGDALDAIAEALADADRNGDGHYLAELHRFKAECLLARFPDRVDAAEALLAEALAIARRQHARLPELRAAASMARLQVCHGKARTAKPLLAELLARFTEGFASDDLRQAKALLRNL